MTGADRRVPEIKKIFGQYRNQANRQIRRYQYWSILQPINKIITLGYSSIPSHYHILSHTKNKCQNKNLLSSAFNLVGPQQKQSQPVKCGETGDELPACANPLGQCEIHKELLGPGWVAVSSAIFFRIFDVILSK